MFMSQNIFRTKSIDDNVKKQAGGGDGKGL